MSIQDRLHTTLEDWKAKNERKVKVSAKKPKGTPKTEKIIRCEWPVKCVLPATHTAIDFGFNPPPVRRFCLDHAQRYRAIERWSVMEKIQP